MRLTQKTLLTTKIPTPTDGLTFDAKPKRRKRKWFVNLTRADRDYARSLRSIGQHVGELINGFPTLASSPDVLPSLLSLLKAYSESLRPWARHVGARMLGEVDISEFTMWRKHSETIGQQLKFEMDLRRNSTGRVMRELLDGQVELITSLPRDAGERVQKLVLAGLVDSTRASDIAEQIAASGEVSKSHATLIARTEVSRTASVLTEAHARSAGSTHYIWRTANDGSVRPGHRAMAGQICSWDNPPGVLENGMIMHFHAGCIWNCRCYPEPIIE